MLIQPMLLLIVVRTKMCLFENEHSFFAPRYFHFTASMFCNVQYSNAKICHNVLNVLFSYAFMLYFYVLPCPFRVYLSLAGRVSLVLTVRCDCFHFYVFSEGVCAAICLKVRVMSEIWCYMCQCICRSYASYSS
jgi:hypothetical protein